MRKGFSAAVVAALVGTFGTAGAAQAAAPNIINDGGMFSGDGQWAESNGATHDGSNRRIHMTFLVAHDAGRRITQVAGSNGTSGVTAQYLGTSGNSAGTNRLATSVVRFSYDPGDPGGWSCSSIFGGTRRRDVGFSFRVIDDIGQSSETVSQDVKFIRTDQCGGADDFPTLESVGQGATTATPGQPVSFSFRCDDADGGGSNDRCDKIFTRSRRLNDGVTSGETERDAEDNVDRSFTMSFPSRGAYVVEARLCSEDSCQDGSWWRIGAVLVNSTAGDTIGGSLGLSGVVGGNPATVNAGTAVTATANFSDSDGTPQVVEWDADGNNVFERTEFTIPVDAGDVVHPSLSSSQLQQSISTATHGLRNISARVTDNGALDAADNERESTTISRALRVNAVPTASGQNVSTAEDTQKAITLSAADADNQPAALTYAASDPPHGTVSCVGKDCTYTPDPNYSGPDSFTFTASDGPVAGQAWATSNTATVNITVAAINDPPVAGDIDVSTPEDTEKSIELVAVDPDSSLTYSATQPANGTVNCSSSGQCTYKPNPDFFGIDQFTYTASDGSQSDTAVVKIAVTSVNDAPVANDTSVSTAEDTEVVFGLPASDVEDASLAVTIVDQPDHGTVSCATTCSYQPQPNYDGPDTFVYKVTDDDGATDEGTISIAVNAVNDAPVAEDTSASTDEDTPVDVVITATDVENDKLSYTVLEAPANGTVTCDQLGKCTYTPNTNYSGGDSFKVLVSDGKGGADDAVVTVTINAVNDPPVAQDMQVETAEDSEVTFAVPASDVEDAELAISAGQGAHGAVACSGVLCTYTPDENYYGPDSFTYTATDDDGASDGGTVAVTVTPVNDAPVANAQEVSTDEDTKLTIQLTGGDVDGDALQFSSGQAAHGTVECVADGRCSYEPDANFHGTDQFEFAAYDGSVADFAVVKITVDAVNDPPVAQDMQVETAEDSEVTFAVPASDVEDAELAISAGQGAHGAVACSGVLCTYTPDENYYGPDSFSYTATDDDGASDGGTVAVTVTPVNDAPVANAQDVSTDEDTKLTIQLTGSDVDGDALQFSSGQAAHGMVECQADGACTYSPEENFHGSDQFVFEARDGSLGDSAVVRVTVEPVNDPPVAQDASATTQEDTAVDVPIVGEDVDGDTLSATPGAAAHGSATCEQMQCTYTPDPNYHGSDAFEVTIRDGAGGTTTATVSVTVASVNDAPDGDAISVSTTEDQPLQFDLSGSDVDGDELSFALGQNGPDHGQVQCDGAGHCLYAPAADYHGPDAFDFVVRDPSGLTGTGTVEITVTPANDPPTAPDAEARVDEDGELQVELPGSDIDGDALTYAKMSGPSHGTASCTADGDCTYEPAENYHGPDAFSYKATDPSGASATGTIRITVTPVNDAPVAGDVDVTTEEDTAVDLALAGSDVDDTVLTYVADAPAHGTLSCAGAACTYTPDPDYSGTDSFTYTVKDQAGLVDQGTVRITITEVRYESELHAGPVVRISSLPLQISVLYKARLVRKDNGAPVSGRVVTFLAGGQTACSGTTGPDGYAACGWSISRSLAVLLDNGYDAVFTGDHDYGPASDHGTIVG